MTDPFSTLLGELGKILHLPLHTDKYHACSIHIPPLTVQLQLNSTQEELFLFAKLIEVPPGRFRENVLREALKTNGQPDPRPGLLGYIAASNQLALYQRYPLAILNGERLANLFAAFYEMGELWKKAIDSGLAAPLKRDR